MLFFLSQIDAEGSVKAQNIWTKAPKEVLALSFENRSGHKSTVNKAIVDRENMLKGYSSDLPNQWTYWLDLQEGSPFVNDRAQSSSCYPGTLSLMKQTTSRIWWLQRQTMTMSCNNQNKNGIIGKSSWVLTEHVFVRLLGPKRPRQGVIWGKWSINLGTYVAQVEYKLFMWYCCYKEYCK